MLLRIMAWEGNHRGCSARSDRSDKCPNLHAPDLETVLNFVRKYRYPMGPITVELSHREKPLGPKTVLDAAAYRYDGEKLHRLVGEVFAPAQK